MLRTLRALGFSICVFAELGASIPVDGVFGSGRGCEMYSVWGMEAARNGIPIFHPGSLAGEELLKQLSDEVDRLLLEEDYDGSPPALLSENGLFFPGLGCLPIATEGDRVTLKCYNVFGETDVLHNTIKRNGDEITLRYIDGKALAFIRCPGST